MLRNKNPIHTIGITEDKKLVIGGLFRIYDEQGFHLSLSIIECKKRGWEPGLWQYFLSAVKTGRSAKKTARAIAEAMGESEEYSCKQISEFDSKLRRACRCQCIAR